MPVSAGVDRQHGFAEPALGFGGDFGESQIRADLQDEFDARVVHLAYGVIKSGRPYDQTLVRA